MGEIRINVIEIFGIKFAQEKVSRIKSSKVQFIVIKKLDVGVVTVS